MCQSNRLRLLCLWFIALSLCLPIIVVVVSHVLVLELEVFLLALLPLCLLSIIAVSVMIDVLLRLHVLIHLLLLHLLLLLLFLFLLLLVALGLLVSPLLRGILLVSTSPHRLRVDKSLGRGESFYLGWLVIHLSSRQLSLLCNLLNFLICEAKVDILWLQIGMDDFTHTVKVVKGHQALLGHNPD